MKFHNSVVNMLYYFPRDLMFTHCGVKPFIDLSWSKCCQVSSKRKGINYLLTEMKFQLKRKFRQTFNQAYLIADVVVRLGDRDAGCIPKVTQAASSALKSLLLSFIRQEASR